MELFDIEVEFVTAGRQLSRLDVARIIGAHSWWCVNEVGELVHDGEIVAGSIEEATEAMVTLGWIGEGMRSNRFARWERIPQQGLKRAAAIRRAVVAPVTADRVTR